ncbi:MAG: acyl-CoA dehydrogenase family protein, partial [Mycobacteriales bacterium]
MNFAENDEELAIRDLARQVLSDRVTADRLTALEVAAPGEAVWDRETWAALVGAGLVAACLPEQDGGGGLGVLGLAVLLEEIGRHVAPVPAVATLALGALPVARFGTPAQRAALLPLMLAGGVLTAALAEPGETDPLSPSTAAVRDGAGWLVSGEKAFVPYAGQAHRILVPALAGAGRVAVFLVDPAAAGVSVVPLLTTNREPYAALELREVAVGEGDVLGEPDAGPQVVTYLAQLGATALACLQAGVCDRALAMTAQYTTGRHQFGHPVASFQAVGQRAADAYVDRELVRLTAYQAAWRLSAGWPAANEVAVAKFWAGEGGSRVLHACQHLHGGIGVDLTYPLHRYFLWTKQIEHDLGTPTRQLLRLGA